MYARTCEDNDLAPGQHKRVGLLFVDHRDAPLEVLHMILVAAPILQACGHKTLSEPCLGWAAPCWLL